MTIDLPPSQDARFVEAQRLFDAGDLTAAEVLYAALAQAAPQNWQPPSQLGHCARRRGEHEAALIQFRHAASLAPNDAIRHLELADTLRDLHRLDEAAVAYTRSLAHAPALIWAHIGLAWCGRSLGNHELALRHFTEVAQRAPNDPLRHCDAADSLRDLGRITDAETTYRHVLTLAPDFVAAHVGLGFCARARGHIATALEHFEAAARLAPGDAARHLHVGDALRDLSRLDEADTAYQRALTLAPGLLWAEIGLGHCALQRGNADFALARFAPLAAQHPADPWRQFDHAEALRALSRHDEAQAAYQRALALDANLAPARAGLAESRRTQLAAGGAGSLDAYREALEADPHAIDIRLAYAVALLQSHQPKAARTEYETILAAQPNHLGALLGLGYCARAAGERRAALARFTQATEAAPDDPQPRLEVAIEQLDLGNFAEGRAALEAVLAKAPHHRAALTTLGQLEARAGRPDAAHAALTSALAAGAPDAGLFTELAGILRTLGHQAKADEYLTQALALTPHHAGAVILAAQQAITRGRIEEAYRLYFEAAAANPAELAFVLGQADALSISGGLAEAIALLEEAEARFGNVSHLWAKRIILLRRAGRFAHSLTLARTATEHFPGEAHIWEARFETEILAGDAAGVQACLSGFPAPDTTARARRLRHHGYWAEARLDLATARRFYQAATRHTPHDPGLYSDLTRTNLLDAKLDDALTSLRRMCELEAPNTRLRGKSLNISQTHFGQTLDEYRMDADLAARINCLRPLPAAQRAESLLALNQIFTDNTLAAVALLIAMRQSGALARLAPRPNAPAIPRLITQYWDNPTAPPDVSALMDSWATQNPDWRVERFSDAQARAYLKERLPPAMLAAYVRGREPAQKADLFRLARLFLEGGVYADADDLCLAPLESWLPARHDLVLYQEDFGTLANNFIAASPRHPLIKSALESAVNAINRGDNDFLWLATGPGLISRAFANLTTATNSAAQPPPGLRVLHRREMFQFMAAHCLAGYQSTSRYWDNSTFARAKPASDD
jgi:tetratricopeptide (TPR) repeat protein